MGSTIVNGPSVLIVVTCSPCLYLMVIGGRSGVFDHPVFFSVLWDVGVVWCSVVTGGVGGQAQSSLGMVEAVGGSNPTHATPFTLILVSSPHPHHPHQPSRLLAFCVRLGALTVGRSVWGACGVIGVSCVSRKALSGGRFEG